MAAMERRQQERQVDGTHRVQCPDRQPARLDPGEALQLRLGRVELGDRAAGARDEQLAGVGHRDAARRAPHERQPELCLQALDLLGERRLGHVLACRRTREVLLVGDRDEVAQLA
jgi:hypothetical protein